MTRIFSRVSNFTIATAFIVLLAGTIASGAAAQNSLQAQPSIDVFAPTDTPAQNGGTPQVQPSDIATQAATLEDLIAQQQPVAALTPELKCLAGAIYFEARNEALEGQLAVGRVIVARTQSGRFPTSYCGVVLQPSQFSFVRHHSIPSVDHAGAQWMQAVAVARIAAEGSWRSPAEGALYFHATRVSPPWHRHRLAQIDNQIFYQ